MPTKPLVAVLMGSKSDWDVMRHAAETLAKFGVAHECKVTSAHRTPADTVEIASTAEARGIEVVIAAAGGAAHLAGVVAAHTVLPVLGVPMESASLKGLDSLLSTVQMPGGIPVGTLAIGKPGAINAASAGHRDSREQPAGTAHKVERVPGKAGRESSRRNTALIDLRQPCREWPATPRVAPTRPFATAARARAQSSQG